MNKDDLNRTFGDPKRQKPITPPDLLAAAHLIRDYCKSVGPGVCIKCILRDLPFGCHLFESSPAEWDLSEAERRTADWIDKQYFEGRRLYFDTDKVKI